MLLPTLETCPSLCPRCRSLLTLGHVLRIPARTRRSIIIFQRYFGCFTVASHSFNFLHNFLHGRKSGIAAAKAVDVLIDLRKVSSQGQFLGDDVSTVCVTISDFSFGLVPGGTFIRIDAIYRANKISKHLGLLGVDHF